MSFRLFIYYCALCGGGGAFVGWGLGRLLAGSDELLAAGVKGLLLGLTVALALSLVDAFWSGAGAVGTGLRVPIAVVIGALGGFVGGIAGQWLLDHLRWAVFYVVGWTLTGLLIGAALGVFDLGAAALRNQDATGPLNKLRNAVLGGTAGGLLGGVLSYLLRVVFAGVFRDKPGELLWSPSAYGFVALGACIGLLIGLAQIILKDGWLKVEQGFRAGREQLLSKPEVTIGRAEGCDLGLFGDPGVERLHARIVRRGQEFIVSDAGTPGGTWVNGERLAGPRVLQSGDTIRLGRCVLRFGERARQAGRGA